MDEERRLLVGVIGAAQGVKGEVRVKSFTGRPGAIGDYGPLSTEDRRRVLEIVALRPVKDDMVVVRFVGVSDRNAAVALTNTRLYVDRARLPAPEEDEFYQVDLIGLVAATESGRELGRVVGVENYGAGDLLEVAGETGGSILVPFTREFVPTIDLGNRRAVIAEGALGSDSEPEPESS